MQILTEKESTICCLQPITRPLTTRTETGFLQDGAGRLHVYQCHCRLRGVPQLPPPLKQNTHTNVFTVYVYNNDNIFVLFKFPRIIIYSVTNQGVTYDQ